MKVGDYVRTNKGYIARIQKITELTIMCDGYIYSSGKYGFDKCLRKENLIRLQVKSSPNIIDLIEVGDYVNGCPVLHKENNELVCGLLLRYKEENIQNVVTKEQFESMEYKVGE